ncbi:MAG: hypothetical protein K9N06_10670 [Candidatus Cloacimonetes bacterium]|nr:hypothetical protein [Candidatus Cloacimonadota bacterium]
MKRSLLLILLTGILHLLGNSIFAPLGYPLSTSGNDIYGDGMGGTGIADLYRINSNSDNPSLMVTANNVTLSTAVNMGYFWYIDANNKFRDDGLSLPYFNIAIPLKNHRLGITLRSLFSGNLDTGGNHVSETDSLIYAESERKTGNIYRMGMEYAFKNDYVNVGLSAQYYLGNSIHYRSQEFEDNDFKDNKYELEKRFSGLNWSLGLSRRFGSLALGFSYEPSVKLDGSSYYKYPFEPEIDTLSTDVDLFEIPATINGGFTFLAKSSLKLSCDFRYRFWEATANKYENNLNGVEESYNDSWRLAGGISYDPLIGYGRWYESIPLRAGACYTKLPFQSYEHDVTELSFTFGSSLQLNSPGRKLDFAWRYTLRNNGVADDKRDESFEFSVGITGIDIFKKSPKRIEEREIPQVDPGMGVQEDTQ